MTGYSLQDLYGIGASSTLSTTDQSIPDAEENQHYSDNTVDDGNGTKKVSNKNMIWGAIGLFIGITVILHCID